METITLIAPNILAAILMLLGGAVLLLPKTIAAFVAIQPISPIGISEIRFILGSFFLGLAAIYLWLQSADTFTVLGIAFLGATIVRFGAIVIDRSISTKKTGSRFAERDPHSPIVRGETPVTLKINGQFHTVRIEPRVTLLDVLRERLELTGTKKGCDRGQCGACTVLVDGDRVYSCLSLAIMQEGRAITTIEGLAKGEQLHPVQAAFIENDGFQCGYCTPGQICATVALLDEINRGSASAVTPDLTRPPQLATLSEAEIEERLSGNLCRCGAYNGIVAAVQQVAGQTPPSPAATILVEEVEV